MKNFAKKNLYVIACIITILFVILPMPFFEYDKERTPYVKGIEIVNPETGETKFSKLDVHQMTNIYPTLIKALSEGHTNLEYEDGVSEILLNMENPYDAQARRNEIFKDEKHPNYFYYWDNAYYNGKYYCYYGIVPALVGLVMYFVSGQIPETYVITMIFAAMLVIGVFTLLKLLRDRFYPKTDIKLLTALSSGLSLATVGGAITHSGVYFAVITAGECFLVWALYLFIKAAFIEEGKKQILFIFLGALCGALVFGCRPPIGFGNILILTLLPIFFSREGKGRLTISKVIIAIIPYVIVAIGLMYYNYIRFDNIFEFGQKYQLTVIDQTEYSLLNFDIVKAVIFIVMYFTSVDSEGSVLLYPILYFILPAVWRCISFKKDKKIPSEDRFIKNLTTVSFILMIITPMINSTMSPIPNYRGFHDIVIYVALLIAIYIMKEGEKDHDIKQYVYIATIASFCFETLFIII